MKVEVEEVKSGVRLKGFLEQRFSIGKCKMMFLTDLYHLPFLLDVDLVRTLRFMDLECSLFVLGVVGWS